jgi:hypothetical protein
MINYMTADEARKLTFAHSERMQKVYTRIADNAKQGRSYASFNTSECTSDEMKVLADKGYSVKYDQAEEDGYQFVAVSWA